MTNQFTLSQLGWKPFFQQQISLEEWETCSFARVVGVERSTIQLLLSDNKQLLPISSAMPPIAVGDWILLDSNNRFIRVLERLSLFSRKAAGSDVSKQLIAANIDTVFIVSSLNQDFNLNRIERYLAMANEAQVKPVIVLTRLDCCKQPDEYLSLIRELNQFLDIELVNALDNNSVEQLKAWCPIGETVALLGSSGVGKSTIVNSLSGTKTQTTHTIREDDDKGRHTTTSRSMHFMPKGGLLLDTPGMRELQIADCENGVDTTFQEIVELSKSCKFSDCKHESEPGCAVKKAIDSGELDKRRLTNYQKLKREQAFNTASLAEKREKDRVFTRHVRSVMAGKRKNRGL